MADGQGKRTLTRGDTFDRTFTLERAEGEEKRYQASLSSEQPCERWFGTEILSHKESAVNMERAGRGLSLLFNHDVDKPIGRVADIRITDKRLRGDLRFSPNSELGLRVQKDVDGGFLGDVSIRYSIDEYETRTDEHGHDTVTITRWTPLEASIVTVPADHTVGVGRSHTPKEKHVTTKSTATGGDEDGDGGNINVVEFERQRSAGSEDAVERGRRLERERVAEINTVFAAFRGRSQGAYDALREHCIEKGSSIEQARQALLDKVAQEPAGQATATGTRQIADDEGTRAFGRVEAGATDTEKLALGMERAIMSRADLLPAAERQKEVGKSEFMAMTLSEMARSWCVAHGVRVQGMTKLQIVGSAFTIGQRGAAGMGTVDFAGILANVASKALLMGWDEAEETWQLWCRSGTLADFKRANRTGLSGFSRLDAVPENSEYKYGKFSDRTEYITAATYGKLFAITRQAIINDDLNAFTGVPRAMGRAANATIGDVVYNSLTTASGVGPTLNQDSLALFHSTHANYDATSGGITVTNLDAGRVKMALQTDPNNSGVLNIKPKYLLVPATLETTAQVVVASTVDPDGRTSASGGAQAANPFKDKLQVIAEGRLDGKTNGTTAWYLLADQNRHDTYEVGFVDGMKTPFLESRNGWTVDGAEFKARIDAGVAALDWRGMYRKRGA